MKRILSFIMALSAVCTVLASCGGGESSSAGSDRAESEGSASSPSDSEGEVLRWKGFDEAYPALEETDISLKNYDHNSKVWENSGLYGQLIESGQDTPPQNKFLLGKYFFGYNGCEVIAGYNMLVLHGETPDMAKLILEFEQNILVAKDGSFGSEPRKMYLLLDYHGIPYEKLTTMDECDKALDEGKDLIFSYYTGRAFFSEIHTIAVTGGDEKYVLNPYNSASEKKRIYGTSDIVEDDKHIIIAYAVSN